MLIFMGQHEANVSQCFPQKHGTGLIVQTVAITKQVGASYNKVIY